MRWRRAPLRAGLCSSAVAALLFSGSCSNHRLVSISVTPQNPSVAKIGDTVQFQASGTTNHAASGPQNLTTTATWSSSTASVATVNSKGLATATGCGTTDITATDGNVVGQTQLTVTCSTGTGGGTPVLQSMNVYPASPTIPQVGQTTQFIALGVYVPATTNNNLTSVATWASSNVAVANVDAAGLSTAVSCGTTTITAQYQGVLAQTELTVACTAPSTPVLQSITLYPSGPTIPQVGQTTQFIALGVYSPASSNNVLTSVATWASSNTSVATVSAAGLATAVGCGTTTITATYQGVVGQMLLTVECTGSQTLQSISVLPSSPIVPQIGQTTQFSALGTLVQGGQVDLTNIATWKSSNTQVATVSNTGLATANSCGTSTITAESQNVAGTALLTVSCGPITSIELIVVKKGTAGASIVSSPPGIDCGMTCGALFNEGTGMTLTATMPATWTGCDQPAAGTVTTTCYFTLVPDPTTTGTQKTVTATFP